MGIPGPERHCSYHQSICDIDLLPCTPPDNMGRPAWANDAQWTFLLGHIERYMTVKGTKATKDFWPGLFDGWVAEWSNLPLDSLIPSAGSLEEGTNPESQVICQGRD